MFDPCTRRILGMSEWVGVQIEWLDRTRDRLPDQTKQAGRSKCTLEIQMELESDTFVPPLLPRLTVIGVVLTRSLFGGFYHLFGRCSVQSRKRLRADNQ